MTRLAAGAELTSGETELAITEIMEGAAADAHVAAFLTALRIRGETPHTVASRRMMTSTSRCARRISSDMMRVRA